MPSVAELYVGNFYSDVICQDHRFHSPYRIQDVALLEPVTRRLVSHVLAEAEQRGIPVMIFETYRSLQRQQELFAHGASRLHRVGVHHYGLACDIVRAVGGEPSWRGDFSFLGELARKNGLIWGGDWGAPETQHTFVDAVHVQRCSVARQAALLAGEWYPEEGYDPYDAAEQRVMVATAT